MRRRTRPRRVRSSRCQVEHERLSEMALRCPLPAAVERLSLAAIRKSFSEACLRDALRLPAPSWTSPCGVMRARPAAGRDPATAQGPPPAPSTQPPVPSPPRLMQKTWGGFPDQHRLLAYLTQAQGREARLAGWPTPGTGTPSRGPPGSTVIPSLTRARGRRVPMHPRPGEPHPGACTTPPGASLSLPSLSRKRCFTRGLWKRACLSREFS